MRHNRPFRCNAARSGRWSLARRAAPCFHWPSLGTLAGSQAGIPRRNALQANVARTNIFQSWHPTRPADDQMATDKRNAAQAQGQPHPRAGLPGAARKLACTSYPPLSDTRKALKRNQRSPMRSTATPSSPRWPRRDDKTHCRGPALMELMAVQRRSMAVQRRSFKIAGAKNRWRLRWLPKSTFKSNQRYSATGRNG